MNRIAFAKTEGGVEEAGSLSQRVGRRSSRSGQESNCIFQVYDLIGRWRKTRMWGKIPTVRVELHSQSLWCDGQCRLSPMNNEALQEPM
jgi:hypothetical protein